MQENNTDKNPEIPVEEKKRSKIRWNNRAIHRDLSFFYFGLILSFSISGIMLNHRLDWHLDQYTVNSKNVMVSINRPDAVHDSIPAAGEAKEATRGRRDGMGRGRHGGPGTGRHHASEGGRQVDGIMIPESFAEDFAKQFGIRDSLRRQFIQKGMLRLNFANHTAVINIKTGRGQITEFRRTPFLSQMVQLHRSNAPAWVWFSDSFALSMILIAITGILLPKGRNSFLRRGWIFSAAGLIIPLLVLFFIL